MLTVTFSGAARTVTGSLYLLEYTDKDGSKFTFSVDAGLFQVGQKVNLFKINSRLIFDPKKLDAIVLTHAHLDHCGRIPYLVKEGFGGRIYSTEATKDIAEVVMLDASKHIGEGEMADLTTNTGEISVESKDNSKNLFEAQRLYTSLDVETTMTRFQTHEYHQKFRIHPNIQVEFFDAGHILGSCTVLITEVSSGRQVVFSGDLGNPGKPIIQDPEMISKTDRLTHIFTETTYGNRVHPEHSPKERLKETINNTIKSKGKVLIPSFSVERAQEVIYLIVELMREGQIKNIPIYLDSPMASKVLTIALNYPELYDKELQAKIKSQTNPLRYKHLQVMDSVAESKTINQFKGSCIIIAGSGMMTGGRILKHLQFYLDHPENTVIVVGYQAEGTLGRQIVDGVPEVEVEGKMIAVKAKLEIINEFSAHADSKMLKKWIGQMVSEKPDVDQYPVTVFLTHGEKNASTEFGKELEHSLGKKVTTHWPRFGEKVTMWPK
ncbi:MBL fold metallo-hydrolase [Candidatus Gracilibacteria bacterium]|nr:MBL fold metallo-hydrolase [Candidatus Gracilibacteria bacterium]